MSERSRKKERQAKRAAARASTPANIAKPSPAPSQRSTFKVAQAQRVIAAQLPTVIRQRTGEKRASAIRLDGPSVQAAPVVNAPSSPKKTVSQVQLREQLTVQRQVPDQQGKCRPKSNAPKGAAGSGKAFVPWKKDC